MLEIYGLRYQEKIEAYRLKINESYYDISISLANNLGIKNCILKDTLDLAIYKNNLLMTEDEFLKGKLSKEINNGMFLIYLLLKSNLDTDILKEIQMKNEAFMLFESSLNIFENKFNTYIITLFILTEDALCLINNICKGKINIKEEIILHRNGKKIFNLSLDFPKDLYLLEALITYLNPPIKASDLCKILMKKNEIETN